MLNNKKSKQVKEIINQGMHDIFARVQKLTKQTGDISPENAERLEEIEKQIALIIIENSKHTN